MWSVRAAETTGPILREWLIAAGTLSAAGVAVYVGVVREWRRRPKLSLDYTGTTGGDAVVVDANRHLSPPEVAYVRLRVVANAGRRAAEGVEVMVVSARETAPRKGYPPRSPPGFSIEGQLLACSNSPPMTTSQTVPPGSHRLVDLLRVEKVDAAEGAASLTRCPATDRKVSSERACASA